MSHCFCGSLQAFEKCCKPYLEGLIVPTAEALMRSRFSAFATANATYIKQTQVDALNIGLEIQSFRQTLQTQKWVKLDIIDSKPDSVAFRALMIYNDTLYTLQENSLFKESEGKWFYSKALSHEDSERPLKRNETCPCGSAKKYKQCCQKV